MHRIKLQKFTAAVLSLIMILSQMTPAFAAETETDYYDQAFIEALRVSDEYAEAHKSGVFEFLASTMNVTEGEKSVQIAVIRSGGTEGQASMDLKIIDVSAEYGQDYVVKVGDGIFKKTLDKNPEARPIVEAYSEVEEITETKDYDEDSILAVIDTAASDSALTVNSVLAENGVDVSDNEENTEDESLYVDEEEENTEDESLYIDEEEENTENESLYVDEEEETLEEVLIDEEEISAEETEEDTSETAVDEETLAEENETVDAAQGKGSSLKSARNAYVGNISDREDWTETIDTSNSDAIDMATGEIMDWAAEIPGVITTITFEDGEYIKFITVEILDDTLSESDEQMLFFLSEPTIGELGGAYKAYLNIADNDVNEKQSFEMGASSITASRDEGVVKVTVKRTAGTAKFGAVNLTTGEVTAKAGEDYEAVTKEVVFPQGVTERTVEIPILKEKANQDGLQFKVFLDTSEGTVKTSKAETIVTLNNPEEADEASVAALTSVQTYDEEYSTAGLKYDENGYYYEVDLDSADSNADIELFGSSAYGSSIYNGTISINGNSNYEVTKTVSVDLSRATQIQVTWANTTSGTYWETKKCKKVTASGYYTNGSNWITFGGASDTFYKTTSDIKFSSSTNTYTVPTKARKTGGSIVFHTRTSGSNKYSNLVVSSVKVYVYTAHYTISLNAGSANAGNNNTLNNSYVDIKNWTVESGGSAYSYDSDNNAYYTQASTNQLAGTVTMTNVSTSGSSKYAEYGNTVTFTASINSEYTDKVYLAGVYMSVNSKNKYYEASNNKVSITFDSSFADTYIGNRYTDKTVTIVPVYKPKTAYIYFPATSDGQIVNHGKSGQNDIMKVTKLDTVNIRAAANSGKYVAGFTVSSTTGKDTNVYSSDALATSSTISSFRSSYLSKAKSNLTADNTGVTWSESSSTNITLVPNALVTQITPYYDDPSLILRANPRNAYKDQGVVYYIDEDDTSNSQATAVDEEGNVTSIEIDPITMGETYVFNSVANDGYITKWQDFTGDSNYDGYLSLDEQTSDVEIDRSAVVGSTFNYLAKLTALPIIYYGFYKENESLEAGIVSGRVNLVRKPVFGSDSTTEAVQNATITIGDKTTTTDSNGFYSIEDDNFADSDRAAVSIYFDGYTYNIVQDVNVSKKVNIDEYDTFSVTSASMYKYVEDDDGEGAYEEIGTSGVQNFDTNMKIVLSTKSDSDVLYAAKAVFNTYDKNGNLVCSDTVNTTDANGSFEYIFNPSTKGISAGSTMTVRFYDQEGTGYITHDMGFTFGRSLGAFSILTSFNSPVQPTLSLIGTVAANFGFGAAGSSDLFETSTVTENGMVNEYQTLSIGFSKSWDSDSDTSKQSKLDKLTEAVKTKANADSTDAEKAEANKTLKDNAKEATDKSSSGNKKQVEIAAQASLSIAVGIDVVMQKSTAEGYEGEYYFKTLVFTVSGDGGFGMTASVPTPIAINIVIGFEISGEVDGVIIISKGALGGESYFDENGGIDFGDMTLLTGDNDETSAFTFYGSLGVAPAITLSAGVDLASILEVTVSGTATFDLDFDTLGYSNGDIIMSAAIKLKILFFSKSWSMGSTTYNMFTNSPRVRTLSLLNEGVETMDMFDLSYMDNRSSWKGSGSDILLMADLSDNDESEYRYNETELITGNNPYPKSVIKQLADGRFIMVFIDDDTSRDEYNYAAVKYSIYSNGSWSNPVIIDNDGTTDEAPDIYVLDNGKVLAVWSSACEAYTAEDTAITSLNKLDIKSAVFDPSTDAFSEPIYITKTTAADFTADTMPKLVSGSFLNSSDYIMCYYTKSEYSASDADGEGVIGDVINPYSVIAYLFYDVNTGEWVHTYSDVDKAEIIETGMAYTNDGELVTADNFDVYEEEWYGQSFVDLGINLIINDTDLYDERGFWTGTPEISVSDSLTDPLVVDSDAISYNNLSIFAYTVDIDGSQETIYDREIYVQVYDFDDNSFTYPIQITSNDVSDSQVKLGRFGESTYLVWLSDGNIKAVDFSNIYKYCLSEYQGGSDTYYYVNKTEDEYIPEIIIADAGDDVEISEFAITTDDEDVYVVWTQSGLTYADGIEQSDEEAANPENQFLEYQVYASRYTADDEESFGSWSIPMQMTFGQGSVYSELTPYISNSGVVSVIAEKGKSSVDSEYGVVEDVNSRSMVRLDFSDFARIEMSDINIEEFMGNDSSYASVTITNIGMDDYDDLTVQFYADGELIDTEEIDTLWSGSETVLGTAISGNSIEVKLYSGSELLASASTDVEYAPEIQFNSSSVNVVSRDYAEFAVEITNSGTATAENLTVTAVSDTTGDVIGETVVENLEPGETAAIELSGNINDEMFDEITPLDDDYYYQESAVFTISADEYANTTADITRYITNEENELLSSIDPVLNDGADSITVALSDYALAYDSITDEYSSLQIRWSSSDENVAEVNDSGLVLGIGIGSAVLTARIMPSDRTIVVLNDGSSSSEDIYNEIPEEGIIVKTINVTVTDEAVTTEETTETTTAEATETTTVKSSSGGGGGGSSSSSKATTTTEASTESSTEASTDDVSSTEAEDNSDTSNDTSGSLNVFDDVKGTWAQEAVMALAEMGIVSGIGNNLFAPERNVTRAEYVTMLMRFLDEYVDADTEDTEQFSDISEDSYYNEYILKAKKAGIAAGYENNEFRPDNNVTRQEMFAFTYRALLSLNLIDAADEVSLDYADKESISNYALEPISALNAEGIVKGSDNYIKPLDYAKRNEAAQMVYNIVQILTLQ